jgi:alcohol dehydrogenase YqhD (iron-dependent ADH family)
MIGHELTALFGIDHGQTLAIVLPSLLEVRREQNARNFCNMHNVLANCERQ